MVAIMLSALLLTDVQLLSFQTLSTLVELAIFLATHVTKVESLLEPSMEQLLEDLSLLDVLQSVSEFSLQVEHLLELLQLLKLQSLVLIPTLSMLRILSRVTTHSMEVEEEITFLLPTKCS